MTSGNFHPIELGKILVNREERQRRDLSGIDILADSIRRLGLIHPIVVTRDNLLVAGERRLVACRSLGWTHISCQYTDELDPRELRKIELEENIKRQNLTWQEQCLALEEYHQTQMETEENWSQAKTSDAIGMAAGWVSENLAAAKEIKKRPDLLSIPRFSTVRGIVERQKARSDEEALAEIEKAARLPNEKKVDSPQSILAVDFREWVKTYVGPKFNFIHCDFPYGIDADKINQGGSRATHGDYVDSADTYFNLLNVLCSNLDRLVTESTHIMFWFSMHFYHDTLEYFAAHSDFVIDPFPLVWIKSDNIGLLPDPQRGPRRIYETCLFGARGDRKVVSAVSNAYAAPTDRSIHMSAKPEPVLRHFFRMFCDQTTLILDPTCGSGTSLRAAESLGARHVLGLEINSEFAGRAQLELGKARRLRKLTQGAGYDKQTKKIESNEGELEPTKESAPGVTASPTENPR